MRILDHSLRCTRAGVGAIFVAELQPANAVNWLWAQASATMRTMDPIERYLPHLSEHALRWVRFLALVLIISALFWLAYRLREILNPIFVALAIAYILNPVVTRLESFGLRR